MITASFDAFRIAKYANCEMYAVSAASSLVGSGNELGIDCQRSAGSVGSHQRRLVTAGYASMLCDEKYRMGSGKFLSLEFRFKKVASKKHVQIRRDFPIPSKY